MEKDFVHFDRDALRIIVRFPDKPTLVVGSDNLSVSYFSGGPGGQNVNKNMAGVRLLYRIPEGYLRATSEVRELIAKSIGERHRERNLTEAFQSLAEKLRRYFYVKPTRKKTKIPKRAKEKRLTGKKIQGLKKQARRQAFEG